MAGAQRHRRGQFIILAAALILIIMVSVVTFLYTNVPTTQIVAQNVLGAVNSVEQALYKVASAGTAYYSTILNVTGNYTYARPKAQALTFSGLADLFNLYSYYGFDYNVSNPQFSAYWYSPTSYTYVKMVAQFNLSSLGVSGMYTNLTQELRIQIVCPPKCPSSGNTQQSAAVVDVYMQGGQPEETLGPTNFFFEVFSQNLGGWVKRPVSTFQNYGNGTYLVAYQGMQSSAYVLGVEDPRNILAIASSYSKITYTFNWGSMSVDEPFIVQIYNNGTMSMLGTTVTTNSVPIPPVPVKDIVVNATISGKNHQTPFQVEDWASNYTVPLGLASNETLFSGYQMIVTEVPAKATSSITVYWVGLDSYNQTAYAIPGTKATGNPFKNLPSSNNCPSSNTGSYSNGNITLCTEINGNGVQLQILSSNGAPLANVGFVRADGTPSNEGGGYSATIVPGVVREILQVEPENGGGFGSAHSVYFQLVILIPANTNYIEVFQRAFFVQTPTSTQRKVNDLNFTHIAPISSGVSLYVGNKPVSNYQAFTNTNISQYWAMVCTNGNGKGNKNGDPCSGSSYVVGFLMSPQQFSALTSFASSFNNMGGCQGGIFASSSNGYVEVDPVISSTCSGGGISFSTAYTVSWWGLLWFSGSKISIDPYTIYNGLYGNNGFSVQVSSS